MGQAGEETPTRRAGRARASSRGLLLRVLLYAFVLASGSMQVAVVPLLPAYTHRFGLTGIDQGMLLAATGLATLVVSLPAGALSDRFGARTVTLWAGGLMAAAALFQAVAPSFVLLLAARLVFGAGYGITWIAGLAWLAEGSPGASSLGGSVASSGIGSVFGPALFGVMGQYFGLKLPFLVAAGAFALVTAALGLIRLPTPAASPPVPIRSGLPVLASDRNTMLATAAIVIATITSSVCYLVVPDILHAHGAGTGAIGLVFSAAAVLFVIGSVITTSLGHRAVSSTVAIGGVIVIAIAVSPAALSAAPFAIVAMLCLSTTARSVVWTVGYPLGAVGAERSHVGLGLVMGLINGAWAATAVATPLLAGVAADHLSTRAVFGLTEAACLVVLVTAVLATRRSRPTAGGLPEPGFVDEMAASCAGAADHAS